MAVTTVKIKSGDTQTFTSTLTIDDVAVDLSGASVLFMLKLCESPNTAYSFAATIVDENAGTVSYTSGVGFPTDAGKYRQEWQATLSDLSVITFPNDGYNTVIILDDLN